MLFGQCLTPKFFGDLRPFGSTLGFFDQAMQRLPFPLRVEIGRVNRRIVQPRSFAHPPITGASNIASREMEQSGVVGLANELKHVQGSVDIRAEGITEIGIKVGQPRTVDDQVKLWPQRLGNLGIQT